MYILQRRTFNNILKIWESWENLIVYDKDNSRNPRLEALQKFEEFNSKIGELWRITHRGHIIIEQR